MRLSPRFVFPCVWTLLAAVLLAFAVTPCEARRVEVVWQDSGPIKSRSQALGEAFAVACLDDALDILRVTLPAPRRAALQQYLNAFSSQLIRAYHEEGIAPVAGGGMRLTVDVDINREQLKERLKSVGIYYTGATPIPCNMQLTGDEQAVAKIQQLQLVAGIETESNAPLRCVLKPSGKNWYGTIDDAGYATSASAATIEDLWAKLWPPYLSKRLLPAESAPQQYATLRVWGWQTPDGAETFDRTLRDWDRAITKVVLMEFSLRPDGVVGVWKMRLIDRAELERRLAEYAGPRKLRFEISAH